MATKKKKPAARKTVTTFDELLLKGVRQGQIPARTDESKKWFRQEAKKIRTKDADLIREDRDRMKNNFRIGSMYFYFYDPKWKKELPYYDTFPLIFPIERYNDRLAWNQFPLPSTTIACKIDGCTL